MARKRPPSFDFFPDDFTAGTYHMPAEAVGIYVRLLCYQWSNGSIPKDESLLCRIAGVDANALRTHMRTLCDKLCENDAGQWYNERLEIERAKKLEIVEKAKRSADARWSKEKQGKSKEIAGSAVNPSPESVDANAMRTQCGGNANAMLPTSYFHLPTSNELNTPLPPKGESSKRSKRKPKTTEGEWVIPQGMNQAKILEALSHFEAMRKSIGKPIANRTNVSRIFQSFDNEDHLLHAITFATANEYQGIKVEYRPAIQPGKPIKRESDLPFIDANWEPA